MKIIDILEKGFTCSVEILPPKGVFNSHKVLERVESLKDVVDFASVTSGAGGKRKRCGTISLSHLIKKDHGTECMSHLTCLDANEAEIKEKLADIYNLGIENILALVGDKPDNEPKIKINPDGQSFFFACDLVRYIRDGEKVSKKPNHFCLGVAAYPEGYEKDKNVDRSAGILKVKENYGADFAITQMVFDQNIYFNFLEKARAEGVTMPIIPSVRLVRSKAQCEYLINQFGVNIPFMGVLEGFSKVAKNYEETFLFNYMRDLCKNLKQGGAPGIHFVILKDTELVQKIVPYLK